MSKSFPVIIGIILFLKTMHRQGTNLLFNTKKIVNSIVNRDESGACNIIDLHLEDVIFNLSSNEVALNKYKKRLFE